MGYVLDKDSIKQVAKNRWLEILPALDHRLAYAVDHLNQHVPCPLGTGSRDGFRLHSASNEDGHAFHNQRPNKHFGDGFELLMWLNDWNFYQCLGRVNAYLTGSIAPAKPLAHGFMTSNKAAAVTGILKHATTSPNDYTQAYLNRRGLGKFSLMSPSILHHKGVTIHHNGKRLEDASGWVTVPALIGRLSSSQGWHGLVIIRITKDGFPATDFMTHEITRLTGTPQNKGSHKQLLKSAPSLNGGAVRFGKAGKRLYIGEGLETMMAISLMHQTDSVAACCTAALLAAAEIPPQVEELIICADKDRNEAGRHAAEQLAERYKRISSITYPQMDIPEGAKGIDFLDILNNRAGLNFSDYQALKK